MYGKVTNHHQYLVSGVYSSVFIPLMQDFFKDFLFCITYKSLVLFKRSLLFEKLFDPSPWAKYPPKKVIYDI